MARHSRFHTILKHHRFITVHMSKHYPPKPLYKQFEYAHKHAGAPPHNYRNSAP